MIDNMSSDEKLFEVDGVNEELARILNDMIHELEKELYTIGIQTKDYMYNLEMKDQKLLEMNEQLNENRGLSSKIHRNNNNIIGEIDSLKIEINKQRHREEYVRKQIYALNTAMQIINRYSTKSNSFEDNSKKFKINDMGISILEAQEIERQRIARDLHDSTVQNLTSMVHKAELCIKLIDIDTIRAKLELNTMSNTLKSVINDMRDIIYNLKPMTIEDLGLTVTLKRYANKLMDLNNIDVNVVANEEPANILSIIKMTVFRVIQEACCNILKHANASMIDINIHYGKDRINIAVKDNGIGFNTDKLTQNNSTQTSSFGLSIMKERISLLSGSLEVQSEPGKGTTIIIDVPLSNYKEEEDE